MGIPDNWRITPRIDGDNCIGSGELFVDHSQNHRTGHLGHALVNCSGEIMAFYTNCSGLRDEGHNGFGWVEYKRSVDGGKTWGPPIIMEHTYKTLLDGLYTCQAEKAIYTNCGTTILFYLNSSSTGKYWEPIYEPTYQRSFDNGRTWEKTKQLCDIRGRVFDVLYKEGIIYVLLFANDCTVTYTGTNPKHVYYLLVSEDDGKTFSVRSILPFDTIGRCYGNMVFRTDGSLVACCYNYNDDSHLDYVISEDDGKNWSEEQRCFCSKRIRNPQIVSFDNKYILHGRGGKRRGANCDFVFYVSDDAIHWDEGSVLCRPIDGANGWQCFYSNNLLIKDEKTESVLIQASVAYKDGLTNIHHWIIEKAREE